MTTFWRQWFLLATGAVALYAVGLVAAGPVATGAFDALGFGPQDGAVPAGPAEDYVFFVYAVLGAVIVGWMVLLAAVAAGPLAAGDPWARPALAASVATWFVLDTGASLVLGWWTHAVYNLAFLALIGLPLARRGGVSPAPRPRS